MIFFIPDQVILYRDFFLLVRPKTESARPLIYYVIRHFWGRMVKKNTLSTPVWNPAYTLNGRVEQWDDFDFPAHYNAYQIYLATKCSFQTQIEFESSLKRHPAPSQTLEGCGIIKWTPIYWFFTSVNLSVTLNWCRCLAKKSQMLITRDSFCTL